MSTPSYHRRRAAVTAVAVAAAVLGASVLGGLPNASAADDPPANEQVGNGTFDTTTDPWWAAGTTLSLVDGRACAQVPGGTTNAWDVMIALNGVRLKKDASYKFSFFAKGTPPRPMKSVVQLAAEPYTAYTVATPELTEAGETYSYTFTAPEGTEGGQVGFQLGGNAEPWSFCLDNVSLIGGDPPQPYVPDTGPRVRVNQVGYLPDGPKGATVVTEATKAPPLAAQGRQGKTVANGQDRPRGVAAHQRAERAHHRLQLRTASAGTGYTLVADGADQPPVRHRRRGVRKAAARRAEVLLHPAQRHRDRRRRCAPDYARPAGHLGVAPNQGDTKVPCQPGVCDYRLDVRGGWYDAGDHGKYVVNGGIAV